jgi:Fe-S-cluster containining protein
VSFYWAEAEPFLGGVVPSALTEKLNPNCLVMQGTNSPAPRCIALQGEIGGEIGCTIYPDRPSVCRSLQPAWLNHMPSLQCDKARQKHGLPVLEPGWFVDPSGPDDAPNPRVA